MYRHTISLCLALIRFYYESLVSFKFNDRHILYHLKFITASNRASLDQDLDSILSGGNDGKHRVVSCI